jgi:chitin disaccharide deacetylase
MKYSALAIIVLLASLGKVYSQTLAEKLGYTSADRLLIISVNDAGLSNASNEAAFSLLNENCASGASVLMPSPWAYQAAGYAKRNAQHIFGLQLCLVNERTSNYLLQPLTAGAGLKNPATLAMYSDAEALYASASTLEVEAELEAQIQKALLLGLQPKYIADHLGVISQHLPYWEIMCKLAGKYKMPIRFYASPRMLAKEVGLRRACLSRNNVYCPDFVYWELYSGMRSPSGVKPALDSVLQNLRPGLSEIFLSPAPSVPEMRAMVADHAFRQQELEWLQSPSTKKLMDSLGIILIGYDKIWQLQNKP